MTSRPSEKTTDQVDRADPKTPDRGSSDTVQPRLQKMQTRLAQFDEISASAKEVFAKKNALYGDAIARTGALGAAVEIVGISARLEHMILGANDAGKIDEEVLVEIVKDGINYFAILGMMIMDDNWRPG